MFKKYRYTIQETLNVLGIDEDTLLQNAEMGKVRLSIEYKNEVVTTAIEEERLESIVYENFYDNKDVPDKAISIVSDWIYEGFVRLSVETVIDIITIGKKTIPNPESFIMGQGNWLPSQLKKDSFKIAVKQGIRFFYLVSNEKPREVTKENLVIDHLELERLKVLLTAASNNPSTTQLEATIQAQQEEIERLKADNEAFKAQITPPQTESNKTHYHCLEKVISEIEAFKDNPEFIKRGKGIQQGLIEDWLKGRTKSRDERTYLKQLITEHYGITTSRSGNPKQTPQ